MMSLTISRIGAVPEDFATCIATASRRNSIIARTTRAAAALPSATFTKDIMQSIRPQSERSCAAHTTSSMTCAREDNKAYDYGYYAAAIKSMSLSHAWKSLNPVRDSFLPSKLVIRHVRPYRRRNPISRIQPACFKTSAIYGAPHKTSRSSTRRSRGVFP